MRAAPAAGESQVHVVRSCASRAHAPDDRPAWDAAGPEEIMGPACRTRRRGPRGTDR
jgi:hypothetical protein